MASQSTAPPLNAAVQKLSWLLGTWESDKAEGFFPTIKPFHYKETLEFTHIGQPNINFRFRSWDAEGKPRHIENGFLRVQPDTNNVAYVAAHNIGITEVEEGQVTGSELSLESTAVHNMSFGSEPRTTKIARVFKLVDDSTLQQAVSMATTKTPDLTPHLTVHYKKADCSGKL